MYKNLTSPQTYLHPLVWSNFFWAIPCWIALYFDAVFLAVLPLIAMGLSIACHATEKIIIKRIDEVFAVSYIIVGPYLLWQVGWPTPGFQISAGITVIALLVFLYSRHIYEKYDEYSYVNTHKWWHILSASMAVSVYLTYFGVI